MIVQQELLAAQFDPYFYLVRHLLNCNSKMLLIGDK